jgi:hypothetical protein
MFPKPRRPSRRRQGHRDPVGPVLRSDVLLRDGGCVAIVLGEIPGSCRGRLTLDHVKDQPRMGRRAPSDAGHLVTLCEHHHLDGWATGHRDLLREYLRRFEDPKG